MLYRTKRISCTWAKFTSASSGFAAAVAIVGAISSGAAHYSADFQLVKDGRSARIEAIRFLKMDM